jgi:hypothetical protein
MEIKMSNKVVIQQQTVNVRNSGHSFKEIAVFDDYAQGSILIDEFFDDEIELLNYVLEYLAAEILEPIQSIFDYITEFETGIEIEDTWHDWEQIKPIIEEAGIT